MRKLNDSIVSFIKYHPIRTQRGLEIITGFIPWLIILFPFAGSFFFPEVVAYFILSFNIYWLYRSWQMVIYGISGFLNVKATEKIDWHKRISLDSQLFDRSKLIHHAIIICNYKETIEILQRNIDSLLTQSLPHKQISIFVAIEEREGKPAVDRANQLLKKYSKRFASFHMCVHSLTPEETVGKHSNETYAAKFAHNYLTMHKKISLENIIVTTSDADCVFHKEYFALLTHTFLSDDKRYFNIYQAPLFMYNNINRVPIFVRIPSIMSGIYFLSILHKQSKRFLNYSTYSLSLKLLTNINYWDLDVIPEDAHLFFKAYFQLSGVTKVIPILVPIYIDAAETTSYIGTLKNSYQQNVRWAWGVTDIPYVIKNFFLHKEIPLLDRLIKLSFAIEWHFVWSSFWFLLTIGANIPTLVNPVFARTTLGLNLSRMSSAILTLSLIGTFTVVFIDVLLNPQYKSKLRAFLHPFTYLQWLILPITGFFFGSLPGLESQTRLMLGKYLEYRVTEKKV